MLNIGIISISDRAFNGVYRDQGLLELESWLSDAIITPFKVEKRLIPDEMSIIRKEISTLVDDFFCHLVLTTGGTGPTDRDVTPEATLLAADRELPGFGEQMRQISLSFVPTAILSRQVGAIRNKSLIVNLPGQPKSIRETLEGLRNDQGEIKVPGIFAAIPYCIQLLEGPYIDTDSQIVSSFRPKKL